MVGISLGLAVWSLMSLSGCSRFALSSVCVISLVVLGLVPFGGSFIGGFSPPAGILMFASPNLFLCVISVRGMQNGLRQWESILWDLKYQQVMKR